MNRSNKVRDPTDPRAFYLDDMLAVTVVLSVWTDWMAARAYCCKKHLKTCPNSQQSPDTLEQAASAAAEAGSEPSRPADPVPSPLITVGLSTPLESEVSPIPLFEMCALFTIKYRIRTTAGHCLWKETLRMRTKCLTSSWPLGLMNRSSSGTVIKS